MQKPVHYITVSYLALLIMIKMMALPILCLQFDLNREYIAATRCENKDRPQMHCSGKCLLKKHMNAAGDMGNTQSQKGNFQLAGVDFFQDLEDIDLYAKQSVKRFYNRHLDTSLNVGFKGNIFHPPIFS